MLNAEELDHFLAIVESMAGEGKTIGEAQARLKDEGLDDDEANKVISVFMTRQNHGND